MTSAIAVRGISKRYYVQHSHRAHTVHEALTRGFASGGGAEAFWALRDITLDVPKGGALGLIGDNGAGKSTLLRLMAGVGRADEGMIALTGRMCALLDLGAGFHGDLTGRENVILGGVISGLSRAAVRRVFDEIVAFAGLEHFIDNPLRTFSTGMRMRLAFAVATVSDPEVLLVDEVLAVGDLAFQQKCVRRIGELRAQGTTLVFCSHQADLVAEVCDRAAWLADGMLRAIGPSATILHEYRSSGVLAHA